MSMFFFLLLCCQEEEPSISEHPPSNEEEVPTPSVNKAMVPQKPEPLVFSPMSLGEPLELAISTAKVNAKIAQAFLSEDAQASLYNPLQQLLSGSAFIEVSAPVRPGTEKPLIALRVSRDQFLTIANVQAGLMSTSKVIRVFDALNAYRMHGGNNADLRIFHFWIALDVGECRIFPVHQDAFSPIKELDLCVEIRGEKRCANNQNAGMMLIPRRCIQESP